MLLVSGASGHLGSLVHAGLSERGQAPLAGSRTPDRTGRRLDFDEPATLDLSGVETLVLVSAGYGEDDEVIARHERVISAAERADVRHVIYTSLIGSGDHLAFALAHRWTERRLRAGTTQWTILRNGLYAELFGSLAAPVDGVVTAPFGAGGLAAVARQDLADAAVEVAANPGQHQGRTYELAGPTALTAADLAAALNATYEPRSLAEQRAALATAPLLPFQPPMLMSIFSATAADLLAGTGGDLAELLPGKPRDALGIAAGAATTG